MSKLNPQKASAYVGPGVLRKGGKITPVPNGPLIKKKGPFKGSTLRSGGTIKKAQTGDTLTVKKPTWQQMTQAEKSAKRTELISKGGTERFKQYKDSISADAKNRLETEFAKGAAKRGMTPAEYSAYIKKQAKGGDAQLEGLDIKGATKRGDSKGSCRTGQKNKGESLRDTKRNGGPIKKAGGMIKRADGSSSRRGLWDNIRANKGSGKKPTKQMLVQEKKIKAKSKK
jgi:hypothetical protein